ncbi:hypothetical protein GIB67_019949, partial [Kingdonia uniflora]
MCSTSTKADKLRHLWARLSYHGTLRFSYYISLHTSFLFSKFVTNTLDNNSRFGLVLAEFYVLVVGTEL